MILSNQVRCFKCEDTPFSGNRHDFRTCKCGNVSVDGGMDYLRRVFETKDYEDISIEINDEAYRASKEAIKWAIETDRNELGILCAVARALRDNGVTIRNVQDLSSTEEPLH